jgi:hypothetical protein
MAFLLVDRGREKRRDHIRQGVMCFGSAEAT